MTTSPKTIINHQQKHILTFSDSTSEGKASRSLRAIEDLMGFNWGFDGMSKAKHGGCGIPRMGIFHGIRFQKKTMVHSLTI